MMMMMVVDEMVHFPCVRLEVQGVSWDGMEQLCVVKEQNQTQNSNMLFANESNGKSAA